MNTGEFEGDELLLGRLHQGASGDAAVRQLRRRYDSLRADYERLLDRLGELEEKLEEPAPPASATKPAPDQAPAGSVGQAITLPLIRLRDEYLIAATRIQGIVSGLERLAAGALKGQHAAPAEPPTAAPAEQAAAAPDDSEAAQAPPVNPEAISNARPQKVHLDVHGRGFGELLDFQERLSAVPGVSRVSINAIDADRATLIVELEPNAEGAAGRE